MIQPARARLAAALLSTADYLRAWGVTLPDDLEAELRAVKATYRDRRDRREPAQAEKFAAEERIARIFWRIFKRQRAQVLEKLQAQYPDRKSIKADIDNWFTFPDDDPDLADLIAELTEATRGGIALFGQRVKPAVDWTLTNVEAAQRARAYAYELVRGINQTSRDALRQVISAFVETPGMTLGMVEKELASIFPPLIPGETAEDRAARIAVTEITRAYADGEMLAGEALQAEFPGVRIIKRWYTREDERVCIICGPLGEAGEIELSETWTVDGEEYDQPPAHVNCILPGQEVMVPGFIGAATKSFYCGRIIEIETHNRRKLAVTDNHPILTSRGWIKAKFLKQGDYILCAVDPQRIISRINPNNDQRPAAIEDIYASLEMSFGTSNVKSLPVNFHGDGVSIKGKINIIRTDGLLRNKCNISFIKKFTELFFDIALMRKIDFPFAGSNIEFLTAPFSSNNRNMSLDSLSRSLIWGHCRPFEPFGLRAASRDNVSLKQPKSKSAPANANLAGKFILRFASNITSDVITNIRYDHSFSGHVYDLQNDLYGLYLVGDVIVKNCRCALETSTALAELD